ncbi:acyl carrier protein [Pseudomonas sp. FYR_11]|uniref:acyl carrier protein n=1 Tax=Pseudomonas TaxID=286 RepID=UPI00370AD8FB
MSALELLLRDALASLLETEPASIGFSKPFDELGVDSLIALRLVRQVVELTGIDIDIECILDYSSIEQLARHLTACRGVDGIEPV